VTAAQNSEPDQAVLMGVADGLRELYSLPEHPSSVDAWLNSDAADHTRRGEPASRRDEPSREMLDEA
jgi:hypothetical protein